MTKVTFGNHSSVLVPREERELIRKFYRDLSVAKSRKPTQTETSSAWGMISISRFSTGMWLTRASSCEPQGRFGWKSSLRM